MTNRSTEVHSLKPPKPLGLAVLISGGGTTLRNLLAAIEAGELAAEVKLVISSTPKAKGLNYAREAGIPIAILEQRSFNRPEEYSETIFDHVNQSGAWLVVMGGFLKHVLIPDHFAHRVVNIHPGLIPAFCGKGFYGHHVHEAVLEYGAKVSGCTVHFVDNQYDHGPIILQRTVPVLDDDTPDSLAARVFEAECRAYPDALRLIAEGRVSVAGRAVRIADQ